MMVPAFDLLLAAALIALAWGAVTSGALFKCIVLFIAFGMLLALTWARLGAPDLALAEAAIGAGFTGVLFLTACRSAPGATVRYGTAACDAGRKRGTSAKPILLALCLLAGALVSWSMLRALPPPDITATAAHTALETHVLANPVTAVLLDYRGYDTLLEMTVLLLALLGLRLLLAGQPLPDPHPDRPIDIPMVAPLLALATPVLVLVALYLLYEGASHPGGAFQAGALLGALGVLLRLTGRLVSAPALRPLFRFSLIAGPGVFALFALSSLSWGDAPLTYPESGAFLLLIGIEFALMLSTAATLVLVFGAVPGLARSGPP